MECMYSNPLTTYLLILIFQIETDTFESNTPLGKKEFTNIIVSHDSCHDCDFIVLAAHYDSKYFTVLLLFSFLLLLFFNFFVFIYFDFFFFQNHLFKILGLSICCSDGFGSAVCNADGHSSIPGDYD